MCLVGVGPVDDPSENLTSMGKFSEPKVIIPQGASRAPPPTEDKAPRRGGAVLPYYNAGISSPGFRR